MTPARRWCVVAIGLVLVIGTPLGLRAIPAQDSDISAQALLLRVQGSAQHPYSGYAESLGTLPLPVADRFTDIGALFGERTRMRVWWRDSDDWRVDKVLATGETGLYRDACCVTMWEYEKSEVTRFVDPEIRLPRTADLLPPELARRLLRDVDAADVARLDARRVAGLDALGLRLSPDAPQASIDHVDLWVDPSTGVPVRVEVFGQGATTSVFTSEFMTFSAATPAAASTRFTPPVGADVSYDDVLDVADAADQYAPFAPPRTLAGLAQSREAGFGAVGVYGSGMTQLIAIPLWDEAAEPLREQLSTTPGVRVISEGDFLRVGPLSVLLTRFEDYGGGWLIAGTVTPETAAVAARQLATRARVVER